MKAMKQILLASLTVLLISAEVGAQEPLDPVAPSSVGAACNKPSIAWPVTGVVLSPGLLWGGMGLAVAGSYGGPRTKGDKVKTAAGAAMAISGAVGIVVSSIMLRRKNKQRREIKRTCIAERYPPVEQVAGPVMFYEVL